MAQILRKTEKTTITDYLVEDGEEIDVEADADEEDDEEAEEETESKRGRPTARQK